jgi:hypothetical protein
MSLNAAQYRALFTNAFGADTNDFGVSIDDSTNVAVGRAGAHVIELEIVQQRPIAWKVDAEQIIEWSGVHKPSDPQRGANAQVLRSKIS